jgi:tetratricopeptide (TPR) repeat protein
MNRKRAVLALLLVAGVADILFFRGNDLYDKAKERTANIEKKIQILEKEQAVIPLNGLVDLELAKAYFERGVNRLGDLERRDQDFERAYDRFLRALTLDPFSPAAHFYFAQALQYIQFLDIAVQDNSLEEYKKAARLSGRDAEIYTEVGKALLARWPSLSPEDRRGTLDIVKEILAGKDFEKTAVILDLWDLHIKDYAVMEKVLPEDALIFRLYARFLGERSLSREERLKVLSRAEGLEFQKVKNEISAGQNALSALRVKDASARFRSVLAVLQNIHFYQDLAGQSLIDRLEFKNALKNASLALAKSKIEETRRIEEALPDLRSYLELEDQLSGAGDLEKFLRERGLLEDRSGLMTKNLSLFSFELFLAYKQNRYRDVVQSGQALESSVLVIPEGAKRDYAVVLEIVGDSYQKLDYLYESNNFYKKSSEIAGPDIALLVKMRKNYERLNDIEGLRTIDQAIQKTASAREILSSEADISLAEALNRTLLLDGRKVRLSLSFAEAPPEPFPYLAVIFNGRIVWEDYLRDPVLSLALPSEAGPNLLTIQALNRPMKLLKITLTAGEDPSGRQ